MNNPRARACTNRAAQEVELEDLYFLAYLVRSLCATMLSVAEIDLSLLLIDTLSTG